VVVDVAEDLSVDAAALAPAPGAARLSLLTPDRSPNQPYVAVRVKDAGPGIAREHLPRLTERFYRVEGQKSGERPGTGLGLSIVKHVANRHRGGFAVDSTVGQGSTFIVYLPMLDAKVAALATPVREALAVSRPAPAPITAAEAVPNAATKVS
jgi:two-component system phosphate regulon sensor histidine kinase PhoR